MDILDDIVAIKKLDKNHTASSIKHIPDQCKQAWEETQKLVFPENFSNIKNILVAGMGGSAYGIRIVKSLYDKERLMDVPIELANNYWLPGYTGPNSLVILSSYSGSTEETLSAAKQAQRVEAKISGITSGGTLGSFLKSHNYPSYIFDPVYNPSKQPRIGVGYMVMGLIGILAKLKKISLPDDEIDKLVAFLRKQSDTLALTVAAENNPAKKLAYKLKDKVPVFIVADFLDGAAYAVRNPFHETAKQFALYFTVPELNHHLLEGLTFPSGLKKYLFFIFIDSSFYHDRNFKRLQLTREIIKKNHLEADSFSLSASSPLMQTMEFIEFGAWVSFYLAMLNQVDPAKIPWVDYFKKNLKKDSPYEGGLV